MKFKIGLMVQLLNAFASWSHGHAYSVVSSEAIQMDELETTVYFQPEQIHLSSIHDNIVITWSTWNNTGTVVEFGRHFGNLNLTQSGSCSKFVDGGDQGRYQFIHRATLVDLRPSTLYVYRVGSNLGWSSLFWFQTLGKGSDWSPRIAIFGDMGNENAQSIPRLQREAQDGMYNMILHIGDMAYNMDDDNARVGDEFMRQIEPIAAYVPYMTSPGNHEQMYNFSNYKARFTMPGNAESMFYSFNVGPVHFISISTEFYYFLNYGLKMVANQYRWLVQDLRVANQPDNRGQQPWIVMLGHRPMYCSTADKDDCTKQNARTRTGLPFLKMFGLEKLLLEYNVDMAIWAHEHDYERFWPLYNNQVLNGSLEQPYTNPRAPVHIITGSAGCTEKHDPFGPKPDITAFRTLDYGYSRMTAHNGTHLELEQVSDDKEGEIVDHIWIINYEHKFPTSN